MMNKNHPHAPSDLINHYAKPDFSFLLRGGLCHVSPMHIMRIARPCTEIKRDSTVGSYLCVMSGISREYVPKTTKVIWVLQLTNRQCAISTAQFGSDEHFPAKPKMETTGRVISNITIWCQDCDTGLRLRCRACAVRAILDPKLRALLPLNPA